MRMPSCLTRACKLVKNGAIDDSGKLFQVLKSTYRLAMEWEIHTVYESVDGKGGDWVVEVEDMVSIRVASFEIMMESLEKRRAFLSDAQLATE